MDANKASAATATAARLVSLEELRQGFGHGWEETWRIGDDEDPERFDLAECVWIAGHIMLESGSAANADGAHWREQYGKKYGMRVWEGGRPPTEEQRKCTPWTDQIAEKPADPSEGKYSGLIAEE